MAQLLDFEEVLRQHVSWKTPADELAGVVRLVKRQLKGNSQIAMDAIYVAVPNKVWLSRFTKAFADERITCFSPKQVMENMTRADEMPLEDFNGSICVGSYGTIAKMRPVHLFCTGLVEGFFPVGNEAPAALEAEAKVLADAVADTPGTLIFSSFKRVSPEEAATWRLPSLRQRREHGRDVVVVTHSHFIDAMYDDAPTLVSGEQYLMHLFG